MINRVSRYAAALLLAAIVITTSANFDKLESLSASAPAYQARVSGKKEKPYDQPAEAENYFRLKRAPDGQSAIPVERYLTAVNHIERMPQYSSASNSFLPSRQDMSAASLDPQALGVWTQLGPGNIGGRTRALLIHPTTPDIMYAAGVAGGVWKSTNAGQSWKALDDLLPNLAVCSLAFDPHNTETIYAGTGEGHFNSDSVRGAGIFKTTDAGASWTYLDRTRTPDFHFVNDIVVSPNESRRVYAATRTGIWRSDDGGASWEKVFNPLGSGSSATVQGGCLDFAIRTDQATDYIFAACGNFSQATVYRNTDAGGVGVWTPVLREPGMGRTTLAIAPSDQSVFYALASSIENNDYNRGLLAVFRSTSNGDPESWSARVRNSDVIKQNTVLLSNPIIALNRECDSRNSASFLNQGWYDNTIAVDPLDADRVWVGGVDLFRSDDGGANWGIASYWWANENEAQYAHADQHTIVFHPQYDGSSNRVMFVGSDGGIFKTNNARAATAKGVGAACSPSNSGMRWTALNNNYGVTQFYYGLPYPDGSSYFGGAQDNGTIRGTDRAGSNAWTEIFGGDGGYVAVDRTDPHRVYVETTRLSIRKSLDGGTTYFPATAGINESGGNFLFINPFIMDPTNSQRLWTGGRFLWRTSDGATSWTQASPSVALGSVSAIAVAPSNADNVLTGTSQGFIHGTNRGRSSSASTTFTASQPRSGFVSWVAFDPTNANVAYATYSTFGGTHVWKSTDAGQSWTGIDGSGDTGIPDVPVHTLVVDPAASEKLYVGTDLGIFVSLDGGQTWARENTGFANVVVESLSLATSGGSTYLYAFTHGRGVWRVAIGPAILKILEATVNGKKLNVYGQAFGSGATVLLNGTDEKTKSDSTYPANTLVAKKAGKKIAAGQIVTLRVRNSDGTLSPEFSFRR